MEISCDPRIHFPSPHNEPCRAEVHMAGRWVAPTVNNNQSIRVVNNESFRQYVEYLPGY